MFGLGQLYQLRGRVGRSPRQAYAYFVVPSLEKVPELARKRLRVILDMYIRPVLRRLSMAVFFCCLSQSVWCGQTAYHRAASQQENTLDTILRNSEKDQNLIEFVLRTPFYKSNKDKGYARYFTKNFLTAMDCAKAIGIVSANQRHVRTFEGIDDVERPGPPLLCVPTTAGSGAEVSQFAIVTDTARRVKIAIASKTLIPDAALLDPEVTVTMPTRQAFVVEMVGREDLNNAIALNSSMHLSNKIGRASCRERV